MRNEEPAGPPEPEPPPRDFHFKPTEFETANRPTDETAADAPPDVRALNRLAGPPVSSAPTHTENEVHAILRANLARAQARGEHEVVPTHRISRRRRDYWLLLTGGNALIVGLVLILPKNVMTVVFGFSGMIFVSLALTWIMWVVMDDY